MKNSEITKPLKSFASFATILWGEHKPCFNLCVTVSAVPLDIRRNVATYLTWCHMNTSGCVIYETTHWCDKRQKYSSLLKTNSSCYIYSKPYIAINCTLYYVYMFIVLVIITISLQAVHYRHLNGIINWGVTPWHCHIKLVYNTIDWAMAIDDKVFRKVNSNN